MDETQRKRLWDDYNRTKAPEIREQIILEYAPLVKVVAGRLSMYLGYNVEYDDLVGYGIFGLIDAIDKFDSLKAVKFETYASLRIRGAILDQIRKMDWIPRTLRQKQKKIDAAMREVEASEGRGATDEEIAERLGITDDEYLNWQSQMKVTNVVSLNEFMESGSEVPQQPEQSRTTAKFDSPEEVIAKNELKQILMDALDLLTEKERKVILLYYYEELTLKEISNVLEVSESRISQLHTRALQKMKTKLGNYMGVLTDSRP
ncbi:MAG: FliA/WhiG family RNA polymerase sigma factor [Lachnospiraceae bacterium]|nr:FliA/WhiG family RNA polymerase sigma factor [Lachnospiraceae bacterium]